MRAPSQSDFFTILQRGHQWEMKQTKTLAVVDQQLQELEAIAKQTNEI